MDIKEIALFVLPLFFQLILPLFSLFLTEKLFRLRNTRNRKWLYVSLVFAAILASVAAQIFIPLAFLVEPLVVFLAFWKLAKISPVKSAGIAIVYSLIFYTIAAFVGVVILNTFGFS